MQQVAFVAPGLHEQASLQRTVFLCEEHVRDAGGCMEERRAVEHHTISFTASDTHGDVLAGIQSVQGSAQCLSFVSSRALRRASNRGEVLREEHQLATGRDRGLCRHTVHRQPVNLLREAIDPLTVRRA